NTTGRSTERRFLLVYFCFVRSSLGAQTATLRTEEHPTLGANLRRCCLHAPDCVGNLRHSPTRVALMQTTLRLNHPRRCQCCYCYRCRTPRVARGWWKWSASPCCWSHCPAHWRRRQNSP